MTSEESIVDAVNRLEAAIARLEMLLKGDQYMQVPGLIYDVKRLQEQMAQMQAMKASTWQWLIGFWLFVSGVVLSNHTSSELLGITPLAGVAIAVLLWSISAVFFLSGLGLSRWK